MAPAVVLCSAQPESPVRTETDSEPSQESKESYGSVDAKGPLFVKNGLHLLSTAFMREERARAIERLRKVPSTQGTLMKYTSTGPLGLFGEVIHTRWFKLNPSDATFSWWISSDCVGVDPPRRSFSLHNLESVDMNEHHNRIYLQFSGAKLVRLKAKDHDDFTYWLEAFKPYVVEEALERQTTLFPASGAPVRNPCKPKVKAKKQDKPLYSMALQYKYGHFFDSWTLGQFREGCAN